MSLESEVNTWNTTARRRATLLAVFTVTFFQTGSTKAFGVFVPEFTEQLSMSTFAVGVTGGVFIGLRALLGPLWSALTRIFSYRVLTIAGGVLSSAGICFAGLSTSGFQLNCSVVLMSIGFGLPLVAKVLALRDYFSESFSEANGVASAGGAVGMIIFAPLLELLIQTYGWRGALMIYGALNLNSAVAGFVMVQPKCASADTKGTKTKESKHKDGTGFLTRLTDQLGLYVFVESPKAAIYVAAIALHDMATSGWILFLVSYTISAGYSSQSASLLSSIGGLGIFLGRLVFPSLVESKFCSGQTMFFILAAGGTASLACYPFFYSLPLLFIISFFTGFFSGATTPLFIVVLHELFPSEESDSFTDAVGLQYLTRGMGRMAGGIITGWIFDSTGSFFAAFLTLAGLEATVAILTIPKPPIPI